MRPNVYHQCARDCCAVTHLSPKVPIPYENCELTELTTAIIRSIELGLQSLNTINYVDLFR